MADSLINYHVIRRYSQLKDNHKTHKQAIITCVRFMKSLRALKIIF